MDQNKSKILCVDFNQKMLSEGKKRLKNYKNIKWKLSNAESLNLPSNSFDFYTISFGLRNTKNINKSIKEAYRVLKKGGRFFCLEFSKVENELLKIIYKKYSNLIPTIGKKIVGDAEPYEYLVNSIKHFYNQEELKHKLIDNLGEVLVPTHQITEVKKGKRTKKEKKYFPGYVLVKVERFRIGGG